MKRTVSITGPKKSAGSAKTTGVGKPDVGRSGLAPMTVSNVNPLSVNSGALTTLAKRTVRTANTNSVHPILYVPPLIMAQMETYMQAARGMEFSAMGTVEVKGDALELTELFLLSQQGTQGTTELDERALNELMDKLEKEGKADKLRLWLHSHPNMQAFYSGTDERTASALAPPGGWFVSLVLGEDRLIGRLDVRVPVSFRADLEIVVGHPTPRELRRAWEQEIEERLHSVHFGNSRDGWATEDIWEDLEECREHRPLDAEIEQQAQRWRMGTWKE